ncbi:MAG: hypothetical protein V4660_03605 [Pseudomonadota bacterium]
MKLCKHCGCSIPFHRRFFVNPDSAVFLPCKNCGEELIEKEKMLVHLIITGVILLVVLVFDDRIPFHEIGVFFIDVFVPLVYFYFFIPFLSD